MMSGMTQGPPSDGAPLPRLRIRFGDLHSTQLEDDIAAGRVFVACAVALPPGAPLELSVQLDGRSVELHARVLRVEEAQGETGSRRLHGGHGMLLQLVAPSSHSQQALLSWARASSEEGVS